MVLLSCLKRNNRECPGCREKRDWLPPSFYQLPRPRKSIARYGNLKKDFYDRLEALPVGALPVRPPTGKYTYFLNRAPGIGIRVDLRGVIVVEHQNKTMRYKFQSDEDIGQTFLVAAEMANYWEENPPQKARRSSVEDSLQVEDGFASSSDGEASS